MIRYDKCPVCQSTGINKILTAKDHTVSGELYEIWQCAHCSLRFTQDVPEAINIGKYYRSENYISHTETNKGVINWLYLRVRKLTLSTKKNFIEKQTGTNSGSILDIGAGTGAFLDHMKKSGWEVEGVEPDTGAIKRANLQYGLNLKSSSALFDIKENTFIAITLWHVLEHVHDLHGYIHQLKKILKPGGKIVIAVPNYTSYDAMYYGADWAAYDVPRHLYHFSPACMLELANIHKLSIRVLQPMWFDSFYVSMLSEKYKTGRSNIIKGFFHGLRSNMKALRNRRKASSIIYVMDDQLPA
jgi:SAM-dependent methyltransferase